MRRLYFLYENLAGTADNSATLLPYAGTVWTADRPGRVVSVTVLATEARTAGTLTVKPTKNGTEQTTINPVLNATNTRFATARGDADDIVYAAGDTIGVNCETAAWTPTTSDAIVIVEVD